LVYREHFSDDEFFYHNHDELISKLEILLTTKKYDAFVGEKLTQHLAWEKLVKQYDTFFETFAIKS